MAEKVFFIVNKYSGKGFQKSVEGEIIDACEALGIEATIEYTKHRGHATELAHEAVALGFERIFARGGDGTMNEVARALVHTPAALGLLPAGSGNGLARHLCVPLVLSKALDQLKNYQILPIDTLLINGGLSINVSGFGFDAHVASQFGKNGQRGLAGYSKLVLGEFFRYQEFDIRAEADGKVVTHRAFMVALANASQFGNNALVCPDASVSDGVLDVCFIRRIPISSAVQFIMKMFRGKIEESRFATILKARHFVAELSSPQPLHLDGEPIPPSNRFEVQIQPASLRVVVPRLD
ncbi:MAG: diacylglycerol kinase family lipid kinase [Cyclobacteriaceae bacterium]|nr:diacylglycerol kinase family lipid kinase [Cyclobacteriaceae bacterium]